MSFAYVAIIAGSAALSATIFKKKVVGLKEILDVSKIPPAELESNPQLKLARNEINTYITGVKDERLHDALIDIMARHNKKIGFFSKLDGEVEFNPLGHIFIKPKKGFFNSIAKLVSKDNGFVAYSAIFLFLILIIYFSIEYGREVDSSFSQALSVLLSIISGFMVYNWFEAMNKMSINGSNKTTHSQYEELFQEYNELKGNDVRTEPQMKI